MMDNDPSQRNKLARDALNHMAAEVVHIPPRSPELNPIENMLNSTKNELARGALQGQIQKESFNKFKIRVLQTVFNYNSSRNNCMVATKHDHLKLIASNGGYWTTY